MEQRQMRPLRYQDLLTQHLHILKGLEYQSGLFAAAKKDVTTGYNKSWLRDNFYECLPFLILGDTAQCKRTYDAILSILLKHEHKLDHALNKGAKLDKHEYIHARYHPITFDEYWEEWGNKQHDAVGAILFGIAALEKRGLHILDTADKIRVTQKLVNYLASLRYWQDPDSGIWEEDEEVHSSSLGACIAGLREIRRISSISVPPQVLERGMAAMSALLPRESKKKFVDLALLSLIWPFEVVTHAQAREILTNVTYHLERSRGIIRYKGDYYYNKNSDGHAEEAEWCFGFSWLAIIYNKLGDVQLARNYLDKARSTINAEGEIPELYFSNSPKHNENTPLGWAEALFVIAIHDLYTKHGR